MSKITLSTHESTLRGIGWMILTGFMFLCVTVIVRHLGSDMPAIEAAFIRYAIGLLLIAPVFLRLRTAPITRSDLKIHAVRGVTHGIAVMLWFYAMARIPIAEVTAIGYTAPIFVTIGAAWFLGERLQVRRIAAVLAGLAGTIIILRPGFQEIGLGQMAQLLAAPFFAASFIFAKLLTGRADPGVIVGMLTIICTLVLLPGAVWQWRNPTGEEIFWLTMTALFATAGHYTLTQAFKAAPITVTQPVGFLQLVWAAIVGVALFDEALDSMVVLGGAIIVAAATYISHREIAIARKGSTRPVPATGMRVPAEPASERARRETAD